MSTKEFPPSSEEDWAPHVLHSLTHNYPILQVALTETTPPSLYCNIFLTTNHSLTAVFETSCRQWVIIIHTTPVCYNNHFIDQKQKTWAVKHIMEVSCCKYAHCLLFIVTSLSPDRICSLWVHNHTSVSVNIGDVRRNWKGLGIPKNIRWGFVDTGRDIYHDVKSAIWNLYGQLFVCTWSSLVQSQGITHFQWDPRNLFWSLEVTTWIR